MRRIALIVAIAACRASPPERVDVGGYLSTLAGTDMATRAQGVASWRLDRATWERTVVPTYASLYDEYARAFEAATPALVAQLGRIEKRAMIITQRHYAGDPKLTLGQARARWALPVQYPSYVVDLDGHALDVVFVNDGPHWRAIVGLDGILRARAAALDPTCAAHLDVTPSPTTKQCTDVSWVIADAALRSDRARFDHACSLASTLCTQ